MHTERWLFEDNINPEIHAKIKRKLRPLAEKLKSQCLLGAKQTLRRPPARTRGDKHEDLLATDRDALGLFCAVSLSRLGATNTWFAFGSSTYAQRARATAIKTVGEDKVLSTGFDRSSPEPQHGNNSRSTWPTSPPLSQRFASAPSCTCAHVARCAQCCAFPN